MLRLAAGDHGFDPAPAQLEAVTVGVVAAVGEQTVGPASWPTDSAPYRRHRLHKRKQLLDVVAVRARQAPGERDPCGVDEEVLLGAGTAPVDRARARFGAPFFAWIWLESITARDHSISP